MHPLWIIFFLIVPMICPFSASARAGSSIVEKQGCFERYESGVVRDQCTGLEWYPGPDRPTDWQAAKDWVSGLEGQGWRMPSQKELDTLSRIGDGVRNIAPILKNAGYWIWAGDTEQSASKWLFGFSYGGEGWNGRPPADGGRAFAVRDAR